MATQSRGAPYPLAADANNTAADIQALSLWVNDRPGVAALTTAQRNALAGVDLWDGRVVANTSTDRLNRYDLGSTTWVVVPDTGDIGALLATTGTPAADAVTATRGVSASAARADHVHPFTATDAAITYGTNIAAVFSGSRVYLRDRMVTFAFEFATSGAIAGGATVMTVPVNYRPPTGRRIWVDGIPDIAADPRIGLVIADTGIVTNQHAIATGKNILGSVTYPAN